MHLSLRVCDPSGSASIKINAAVSQQISIPLAFTFPPNQQEQAVTPYGMAWSHEWWAHVQDLLGKDLFMTLNGPKVFVVNELEIFTKYKVK